jgi:hypothetical protein
MRSFYLKKKHCRRHVDDQKERQSSAQHLPGRAAESYTTTTGTRVAMIDAQRQIELIGEELCRTHKADFAIITRYDHVAKRTRYTIYNIRANASAVAWARELGFDAGGSERISGFTSEQSVRPFLTLIEQQ